MPTFRLATCRGISLPPMTRTSPKGMTANTTRAGNSAAAGASVCSTRCAPSGIKSSLAIILMPSAMMCSNPPAVMFPTLARFGPMRSCMKALCLRSAQVSKAARLSKANSTTPALISTITKSRNTVVYPSVLSAAAACPHRDVTVLCYASKNKSDPTPTLPHRGAGTLWSRRWDFSLVWGVLRTGHGVDVLNVLRQPVLVPACTTILRAEHLATACGAVDLVGITGMQPHGHHGAVCLDAMIEALPGLAQILTPVE